MILIERLELFVPLAGEELNFFVSFFVVFFEFIEFVLGRLPLFFSDLAQGNRSLVGALKIGFSLLARVVLVILLP